MKMAESSLRGYKQLEKEKLLVLRAFSPFLSVFKRFVKQTCKNMGLFGKGLKVRECGKLYYSQVHRSIK